MSENNEYKSIENGKEAPQRDPLEHELLDVIAIAEEAPGDPLPTLARDAIACKIASIVDGMDGIRRNYNGRYPAHSIDQVVSAVSPRISAAGLRIKTEVLDIEPFAILDNMPFWRESNGRQEQYTRDVHLFRMKLLFTVIDGATGECDRHQWTHVFEIGRSEQDQDCGAAVSYGTKDFLKRQFMIADDSDDPDFKSGGAARRIDPKTLDGQLVPIISIEPNTRKRSDRSPGWFAKDETGQISIAMWDTSFKTIDMLMRWNSGTMLTLLEENESRHRFNAPLMLRVSANQYGLNLARDGQLNTLGNPAVAEQFMQAARNIIPSLTAEQAAEYLDVAQLADFKEDMGAALQVIHTAKRFAASNGDAASDANSSGGPLAEFDSAKQSRPKTKQAPLASTGASRRTSSMRAGSSNGDGDPARAVQDPPSDAYEDF